MNEADTSSIAYCGLHCGDCPNHTGKIADLARDLRKKLREHHFWRVASELAAFSKPFAKYEPCYETIGAMMKLRCKRGCRDNGGPPQCKIRNCCRKHDFQGCWPCADFETCEKLSFLTPTHGRPNEGPQDEQQALSSCVPHGEEILVSVDGSAILVSQVIIDEYFMCVRAHTNRLRRSFSACIAHTLEAGTSRKAGERSLFGSCPGTSHLRTPTITIKKCPRCGEDVEIFSSDVKVKCGKCGFTVFNDMNLCVHWCAYAKECVGPELYEQLTKGDKEQTKSP